MNTQMSRKGRAVCSMVLLSVSPWLMPGSVYAADNLSFKGRLVAEPCSIRPGDEALELDLREVSAQELYLNNRTTGRPFEIHLEGCDTRIADSVTTTFSGVESAELPGLLRLDGGSAASGVAIGLETPDNTPLPLNITSDKQTLNDGPNTIAFKAFIKGEPRALADRLIVAGLFTATSTFTLDYP